MTKNCIEVAIIGAGIAGMSAAAHLRTAGVNAVVFDKARGPGGRTASRRQEELRFDHGAPGFEAQDPSFLAVVAQWQAKGLVEPWATQVATLNPAGEMSQRSSASYVVTPKMSALARALGQGIESRYSTRIATVHSDGQAWQLTDTESQTYFAKRILCTAPPPQTIDLLADHAPEICRLLRKVELCPDWTLMLLGEPELLATGLGRLHFEGHPSLSQVIAEHRKPQRPQVPAWTLHANTGWSRTHEEAEPDWVVEQLCAALSQSTDRSLNFQTIKVHRWRYARVRANLQAAHLADKGRQLYYAGDACLGGDLEAAYLSGLSAAKALIADA